MFTILLRKNILKTRVLTKIKELYREIRHKKQCLFLSKRNVYPTFRDAKYFFKRKRKQVSRTLSFGTKMVVEKSFYKIELADVLGFGMRNTYKYTQLYSGKNPLFVE